MTNIVISGQGLGFLVPTQSSTDYFEGSTSGYFNASGYRASWTGINLTYATTNVTPTWGTLTSYTVYNGQGRLQYSYSGFSYTLKEVTSDFYATILAGNNNWTGSAGSDTFYWAPGNDSFNGLGGLDTVDFVTAFSGLLQH